MLKGGSRAQSCIHEPGEITASDGKHIHDLRANMMLLLTDDQDFLLGARGLYDSLGSLAAMPTVRRRLMDEGSTFERFIASTPICCPSRVTLLSGRFAHNLATDLGRLGCMHANTSFATHPAHGLFGALSHRGYLTAAFGKVTNLPTDLEDAVGYGSLDYVDSPVDYKHYFPSLYQRFDRSSGGGQWLESLGVSHANATWPWVSHYITSQMGNRTVRFLKKMGLRHRRAPFFVWVGFTAPHYPAQPAPWHEGHFPGLTAPVTPNYNRTGSGKPRHVAHNPPFTQRVKCWQDQV